MEITKYKHAGIAGKFRLLHKAHIELLLRAVSITEHLHVFIVDLPEYKRYASIEKLQQSFIEVFESIGHFNYSLHIITENLNGRAWDEKLLTLVPELETMFDSKELYGNILVNNEFIQLQASLEISVTNIETNIFAKDKFYLITKEFRKYINKKIIITGKQKTGVTTLTKKLGHYYSVTINTQFNDMNDALYEYIANKKEGLEDFIETSIYTIVDQFLDARRMLLINDDIIKLYYNLLKNEADILSLQIVTKEVLNTIYQKIEAFLITFIQDIDQYFYCTDAGEVDDLLQFYYRFLPKEKLIVITANTYENLFNNTIKEINNYMNITD